MKAIVYHEYGSADVLRYEEVEKPIPKDDEVLIKMRAASVNPLDWRFIRGKPLVIRLTAKMMKVAGRPGVDVAGEVEAVGKNVTQFKPGDAVFGSARAALSEFVCTGEKKVTLKPEAVTFEQAASVNVAGLTALQGLRDKAKVRAGSKVLINGAAGGVGTFAMQIAKSFGAHVTGVCSTRNVELVRSIGADEVIDYTQQDCTRGNERFDAILDCVGNHSFAEYRRVMNPGGRFVGVGAPHDASLLAITGSLIKDQFVSAFGNKKSVMFIAKANKDDLKLIGEMIVTGKIKPVIESVYSLSDGAAAVREVEQGHARGKVIVKGN